MTHSTKVRFGARRWTGLLVLCAALLLEGMNIGSVNVQLAPISADLGIAPAALQYIVSAYLVCYAGFLLLGGRAADLFGRRRVFLIGVSVFLLASLLAAMAGGLTVLIVARALQGIGAAISTPAALALIISMFAEGPERNKAMGVYGAMGAAGFSVGLLVTGFFTEWLGWRAGFAVYAPLTLAVILLCPFVVPADRPEDLSKGGKDIAGAVTITLGLLALTFGVGESHVLSLSQSLVLFGAALMLFLAFAWIETHSRDPLIPFRIFSAGSVLAGNLLAASFFAGVAGMMFVAALYLQSVLHMSPFYAGLAFAPMSLMLVVSNNLSAVFINRIGMRRTIALGLALQVAGIVWFAQATEVTSYWANLLPSSLVLGLGIGLIFPAAMLAGTTGPDEHQRGLASSLVATSQQTGGALGTALTATMLGSVAHGGNLSEAMGPALLSVALLPALGLAVTWAALRRPSASSALALH
ncbi:MFS transporter [Mameliella alba]|nr:MFS transporter [Antarctobacter heliothermus]MBY6144465.1 MFS transporter [Mameliella alba]MCA0954514.1 MFS transporter [Mameliella alba]